MGKQAFVRHNVRLEVLLVFALLLQGLSHSRGVTTQPDLSSRQQTELIFHQYVGLDKTDANEIEDFLNVLQAWIRAGVEDYAFLEDGGLTNIAGLLRKIVDDKWLIRLEWPVSPILDVFEEIMISNATYIRKATAAKQDRTLYFNSILEDMFVVWAAKTLTRRTGVTGGRFATSRLQLIAEVFRYTSQNFKGIDWQAVAQPDGNVSPGIIVPYNAVPVEDDNEIEVNKNGLFTVVFLYFGNTHFYMHASNQNDLVHESNSNIGSSAVHISDSTPVTTVRLSGWNSSRTLDTPMVTRMSFTSSVSLEDNQCARWSNEEDTWKFDCETKIRERSIDCYCKHLTSYAVFKTFTEPQASSTSTIKAQSIVTALLITASLVDLIWVLLAWTRKIYREKPGVIITTHSATATCMFKLIAAVGLSSNGSDGICAAISLALVLFMVAMTFWIVLELHLHFCFSPANWRYELDVKCHADALPSREIKRKEEEPVVIRHPEQWTRGRGLARVVLGWMLPMFTVLQAWVMSEASPSSKLINDTDGICFLKGIELFLLLGGLIALIFIAYGWTILLLARRVISYSSVKDNLDVRLGILKFSIKICVRLCAVIALNMSFVTAVSINHNFMLPMAFVALGQSVLSLLIVGGCTIPFLGNSTPNEIAMGTQ